MKILLTTFYDERCTGMRIIASCLKKAQYNVKICIVKAHCVKRVNQFPIEHDAYQVIASDGYSVYMNDADPITEQEEKLFYDYIEKEKFTVIGFSLRSYLNKIVLKFIHKIRTQFPHIKIVVGGYAPTLEPELFVPHVDAVIRGEGEDAMLELCHCFRNNLPYIYIYNLSYFQNGKCMNNPLRCAEKDISRFPWPFGSHDGEENIVSINNNTLKTGDPLTSWKAYCFLLGRGCLGSCSYCSGGNWIKMYHKAGFKIPLRRMKNIDDAISELKRAKNDGYARIHFTDEYFAAPLHYLNEFLDKYEQEINLPVEMFLHYEMINNHPEILTRLKKLNLKKVAVGIQSGSEKFAREIYSRKTSHQTILNFIHLIHEQNISANLHFIFGNPLETEEIFRESLDFLKQIPFIKGFDILTCFRFTAFPHSPIVEKYGNAVTAPVSNAVFERQGCLAQLRVLLQDDEFLPLLENKSYMENPEELRTLYYNLLNIAL